MSGKSFRTMDGHATGVFIHPSSAVSGTLVWSRSRFLTPYYGHGHAIQTLLSPLLSQSETRSIGGEGPLYTLNVIVEQLLNFRAVSMQLFGCEENLDWIIFHDIIWTSKIYVRTVCPVSSSTAISLLPSAPSALLSFFFLLSSSSSSPPLLLSSSLLFFFSFFSLLRCRRHSRRLILFTSSVITPVIL